MIEPSTNIHFDFILIGAGGAGMNIIYRLLKEGVLENKRLLILDPQEKSHNDRTWCFWARPDEAIPNDFGSVISKSWTHCALDDQLQPLNPYKYYHIRGIDFYNFIKEKIDRHDNISWLYKEASEVIANAGKLSLQADGQQFTANYIFDSRLKADQIEKLAGGKTIWQTFYGWRVKLSECLLNSEAFTMMDFNIPQMDSTQFIYMLPFDEDDMLIEVTRFDRNKMTQKEAELILSQRMSEFKVNYEIIEIEKGQIPMTLSLDPLVSSHSYECRHIPIGTAAGNVKSTTGYAFKSMFEHANQVVSAIVTDSKIPTPKRDQRYTFYDRLLLTILWHMPLWGKPIFTSLLSKVSTARVIKFLDEDTSVIEDIPILWSLPFRPFFKSLYINYIPSYFHSSRTFPIEVITVLLTIVLALFYQLSNQPPMWFGVTILSLGLLYPGIPHGACDHFAGGVKQMNIVNMAIFTVRYLLIMALILALWLISPSAGLLLFLLYSAWHFGETDVSNWASYHPATSWLYGSALLVFLLLSHPQDTIFYLDAFGVTGVESFILTYDTLLVFISLSALIVTGLLLPKRSRWSWGFTMVVVLGGVFMPLIPAFALYFIGLHSFRGWYHLKEGLNISSFNLFKKSMPFSFGAYAIFIILFLMSKTYNLDIEGYIPWVFIFIASISAPHIFLMHSFYKRQRKTQ